METETRGHAPRRNAARGVHAALVTFGDKLALDLHVPPAVIGEILHGRRGISADTALRLARHFGASPKFWMNRQRNYEVTAKKLKA